MKQSLPFAVMFNLIITRLLEIQIKPKPRRAAKGNFLFLESNLLDAANGNDHNGADADDLMCCAAATHRVV